MADQEPAPQMCIECEDTEAAYSCTQCGDVFCELCYMWLHSRGKRREHTKIELPNAQKKKRAAPGHTQVLQERFPEPAQLLAINDDRNRGPSEAGSESTLHPSHSLKLTDDDLKLREAVLSELEVVPLIERCKYIPLRLDEEERQLLNILEGALEVSEYTDNVDVADSDYGGRYWGFSFWSQPYSKHERGGPSRGELIKQQLQEVFDLLTGLYQSSDYRLGSQLIKSDNDADKIAFLQRIFEVGRRYKIMNSEKMRTTYGKMMYILQDAAKPNRLSFPVIIPIKTVYSMLEEKDSLHLISDKRAVELMLAATHDSMPGDKESISDQKKGDLLQKSEAVKKLILEYKSDKLSENDILRCINSIADNTTFITLERWPVDRMLYNLTTYFSPQKGHGPKLDIHAGYNGSKLSHDHTTQFTFVLQSLMLWREVINNMFRLWFETEGDLLSSESPYSLRDTGQGLNRLQQCYNVSKAMHSILGRVQHQARGWVGLSVIHLGDRDVPNSLMFIDKYTQVSRILGPVVSCISRMDELQKDASIKRYFDKCGGLEHIKVAVLQDYFRHGFDGSGSDGGSCIDGRLTSSWNWCSKIEKKGYFPVFLLSGFKGFDGRF
eukprot:Phypoly_transcript_04972.p1 GENE.Phypoly_transcript_04972~~Phypoly_transcript_04972.p1  ORF type:complete len:625 (+),score=68.93 Phypoly_transcript_04972:53-1876(+)